MHKYIIYGNMTGNTSFLAEPDAMYLNGELFQRIVTMAWFLDDRSVDLSFATHFENVIWHDAISLTVPQSTTFCFHIFFA